MDSDTPLKIIGKECILIIEDDKPLREIYSKILSQQGFLTSSASSLRAAKEKMRSAPFAAVLCDIFIPPENGMDLLTFKKKVRPDTPVVLVTGLPSIDSAIHAIREGAYDYLIKPVSPIKLIETIHRAVRFYHLTVTNRKAIDENRKMRLQLEHLLKHRTDELIESRERYRLLFKGSKDAVFITTREGRWLFDVNNAALDMIGYSKDELLHLPLESLFVKPFVAALLGKRLIRDGFVRDYPVLLKQKGGKMIHCSITASVYYTREKVMAGFHGVVRDVTLQREAALKLRRQKEFLESVITSLSHPFSVIDVSYRKVLMQNRAALNKTNFLGRAGCFSLLNDSNRFCDGFQNISPLSLALREKRPVVVEHRYKDENGRIKDFEIHGHPIFDDTGHMIQMIEYAIEITEKKRAERELVKRETILEAVRYSAETFLKSDRWDENIHRVLKRLGKALKVSRLSIFEAVNTHYSEKATLNLRHVWQEEGEDMATRDQQMAHIDFEKEGLLRWRSLLEKGKAIYGTIEDFPEGEQEVLSGRGVLSGVILPIFIKKRWWGALVFDEQREKRSWSVTEIDGLKVAAETLGAAIYHNEQAKDRILLASALEQHSDGIIILNTAQRITYVNPAFETMTGYSFFEVIDSPMDFLNPDFKNEKVLYDMNEQLRVGNTYRAELTNRKKDGSPYREEMTLFLVTDEMGNILNYVAIKRDVTEKHRLESIAEAANMMENIGYIFAGIRHEIGNPLNSIKMTLTVLKKNVSHYSKEKVEAFLDRTLNEILRVEYLLKAFRNFSLYESPDIKAIDLIQFMEGFRKLILSDFEKRAITVRFEYKEKKALGFTDPRMLNQVMLNLIINAADAMADVSSPLIYIRIQPVPEKIRIQVSDNGYGLSDEEKKRIFTPFYTTKAKGTGLGLVIVRKMLLSMNASIRVESLKGKGTTFTFDLPRLYQEHEKTMLNF